MRPPPDEVVTIAPGWTVVLLDGLLLVPGEALEVDAATAAHWRSRGWAVPAQREEVR